MHHLIAAVACRDRGRFDSVGPLPRAGPVREGVVVHAVDVDDGFHARIGGMRTDTFLGRAARAPLRAPA